MVSDNVEHIEKHRTKAWNTGHTFFYFGWGGEGEGEGGGVKFHLKQSSALICMLP